MSEMKTKILPVLPLGNGVLLPIMVVPLALETSDAKAAVTVARGSDGVLIVVARVHGTYAPGGCVAKIVNTGRTPVSGRAVCEDRVYPGFPTIFRGLSGFFVGDLRKRPCGSSWKTRSVFQGAVGALCASTAPSASTGPVRVRQNGSRGGNGELDRRRPRTAVDP